MKQITLFPLFLIFLFTFNSLAAIDVDDKGNTQTMDPAITTLVLVNATNNQDIMTLVDGLTININDFPSTSLSIRAEGSGTIGSVQMVLTGPVSNTRTENVAPYTLFGDAAGNYAGQSLGIGSYGISTTPYNQRNLGGSPGSGLDIQFTIDDGSSQRPFVSTWKTDNQGSSGDNQITIPTFPGETYKYSVDWGDGNSSTGVNGAITYTYNSIGTYTVSITGDFPRIYFSNQGDKEKILSVEQWGDISWSSTSRAFADCSNLDVVATDIPDLSNVNDLSTMFIGCSSLVGNPSFNNWNLSTVTDVWGMFDSAVLFNQPIGNWDVSNVENFSGMFNVTSFNQDIGNWDVGSGIQFAYMFEFSQFNQDISDWDVSSVNDMSFMFSNSAFDQNIGGWNVSNVTSMTGMFAGASLSIENYDALLKGWNNQQLRSGVTFDGGNSQYCKGASARWNLINTLGWTITDGGLNCPQVTVPNIVGLPLAEALAALAEVGLMIDGATDASNDIIPSGAVSFQFTEAGTIVDSWPYINVEVSTGLPDIPLTVAGFNFVYADIDADHFSVTPGVNIEVETYSPRSLTIRAIATQDVASVQLELSGPINHTITQNSAPFALFGHESGDFDGRIFPAGMYTITATPFSGHNLSGTSGSPLTITFRVREINTQRPFITTWKTDNVGASNDNQITIPTFPGEIYNYSVDWGDGNSNSGVNGDITHTYGTPGTYQVSISGDFPTIFFASYPGNEANSDSNKILEVNQWGDIQWRTMLASFASCANLDVVATDVPDLSNVSNLFSMFESCGSLVGNEAFANWNVSSISDMTQMFANCTLFNEDISSWDVSNVTGMANLFTNCTSFNQDISSWDVSQVTNMWTMFNGATIFNQNIGNWDVSKVTTMAGMFNFSSFNQDISNWDVSNVTDMLFMFNLNASFNQDISNWNVSKVTDMTRMFGGATTFDQNIGGWNVSNVTNMTDMFSGVMLSLENYDSLLNGWSTQQLQNGVTFDGGNSQYCLGEAGRQNLIDDFGWTITDGGLDPVNCQNPALSITDFVLVDAITDVDIVTLVDGDNIDLSSLPSTSLNIRANTAGDVSSVRLDLAGTLVSNRTEGKAPYALFGDSNGNYVGRQMPAGPYALSATPYSAPRATGDAGNTATINFTFNNNAAKGIDAIATATYDIDLYPNAASEAVNISVSDPDVSVAYFVVYDILGRQVGKFNANEVTSGTEFRLPVNQYQAGIYFVMTVDTTGRVSQNQLVVK